MGIVNELQRDALDESIPIETLMRKAYLVARKLNLKDFEEWIIQEQNGYKDKVPEYRNVMVEIKAWNPYIGWVSIVMPAEMANLLSKKPICTSISELQDIYNSKGDVVGLTVNGELTELLNSQINGIPTNYRFFTSKSELYRIINTVRNKILEWTLLLEENGITGEEMGFTDLEKKNAHNSQVMMISLR